MAALQTACASCSGHCYVSSLKLELVCELVCEFVCVLFWQLVVATDPKSERVHNKSTNGSIILEILAILY